MAHKIVTLRKPSKCAHCTQQIRSGSRASAVANGTGEDRSYHHVCLQCSLAGLVTHTPNRGNASKERK